MGCGQSTARGGGNEPSRPVRSNRSHQAQRRQRRPPRPAPAPIQLYSLSTEGSVSGFEAWPSIAPEEYASRSQISLPQRPSKREEVAVSRQIERRLTRRNALDFNIRLVERDEVPSSEREAKIRRMIQTDYEEHLKDNPLGYNLDAEYAKMIADREIVEGVIRPDRTPTRTPDRSLHRVPSRPLSDLMERDEPPPAPPIPRTGSPSADIYRRARSQPAPSARSRNRSRSRPRRQAANREVERGRSGTPLAEPSTRPTTVGNRSGAASGGRSASTAPEPVAGPSGYNRGHRRRPAGDYGDGGWV